MKTLKFKVRLVNYGLERTPAPIQVGRGMTTLPQALEAVSAGPWPIDGGLYSVTALRER